jgi:hypothetical protein
MNAGQRRVAHRQRVGGAGDVDAARDFDVEIVETGMDAPRAAADGEEGSFLPDQRLEGRMRGGRPQVIALEEATRDRLPINKSPW